jgi:hypothetical protein
MNEKRGGWFLITGLILGLGIGLLIAWVISPVAFVDTAPATLRPDYKDQYRRMIALAFVADNDIGRAKQRLTLLQDQEPVKVLSAQAQQVLAAGGSAEDAKALALLASALNDQPNASAPTTQAPTGAPGQDATLDVSQAVQTPTPENTQIVTAAPTFTPRPTQNAQATLASPFYLVDKQAVCNPKLPEGLLQIQANSASGQPADGLRVHVTWKDGENYFYTGLIPAVNLGYAEFSMTQGKVYSVQVGDGGEPVNDLTPQECTNPDGGATYLGGWSLEFGQH